MDPVVDEMEHKRIELTQKASAVQFQINDLNTKISSKKMQIQNFKNQRNDFAVNSVEQSMKLLYIEVGEKEKMLRLLNYELNNLQKAEVNEVRQEEKVEKESIKSGNKYVAGAMKAHGHLKTVHGHMNILFILLVIFSIYLDIFSISGTPFGVMNIPILGAVPVFIIIQIFLIMWFLIDSKNYGDFVLLSVLFALKYIIPIMVQVPFENFVKFIPILIILCILKYSSSEGTSVNLKSIMWTGVLFAVFAIIISLVPMITSLPSDWGIGTASASPNGMADDGSTASDSSSTSSAISGISDFWCAIAPIFCDTAAETSEDDGTGDGSTSDGTVNSVDLALAVPLKTVSTRVDDLASSGEFNWKIKNDGLKSIDSVLFLMDGSQIQDNHSGEIYNLATGYDSSSDRIEYSGVDIDGGLFYKQLGLISRGGDNNIKVKFDSPQCSLTQFKAPVYLLYTYEIDYNIMLTLVGKNWSDKLDEQGVPLDVNVIESVSTVGPFSVSIYPDEMEQPVVISKDDSFTIYIELVKNHPGRAAISSFEIDVSPMLLPQDLDTTRCSFAKAPSDPSSNLDSYVLRDILYDQINNVDLLLNNGLNKEIVYKCSFKYDPANFDKDLIDRTQQRYIGVHIEYTYIYDGLFILNTGNFTDIDSC